MSQIQVHWCWWLSIGLSLGCQASAPGTPVESRLIEDEEYSSQQGRRLLGFNGPDVRRPTFAPPIVHARVSAHGLLEADGMSGVDFLGAPFEALAYGDTVKMRIAGVAKPEAPDQPWHYALEQMDPLTNQWVPACAQPEPVFPSPVPSPLAIAMPGWWTDDRIYVEDATAVTFSCMSGVAAKCDHWGYAVGATPPAVTQSGQASDANGPDVTVACVRMASADYCAQGIPGTFDGTSIHIHDVFGGPHPPEHDLDGYFFEAAWRGRSIKKDGQRVVGPALCLSKLRWSTLPLGGSCPQALPDPRVSRRTRFCEEYSPAELEQMGALLYDDSPYLDAGLISWSLNAPATPYFTSTRLLAGHHPDPPKWLTAPPPGLVVPTAVQQLEATVFDPTLPAALAVNLVPLYSYDCAGDDLATTTVDLSASCSRIAHEGYVYAPGTPGRSVLRRWWNPAQRVSRTTARSPAAMIAGGWQLAEVVGGVPRASFDVTVRWSALAGYSYALDVQTTAGEWIAPCIAQAQIGSATSVVYPGSCSANGRVVSSADVAAFRVLYQRPNGPVRSATLAYDGVAPDAYVAIAHGTPTAVAVSWNDLGRDYTYALEVLAKPSGEWTKGCVREEQLANDVSHVFTGQCPGLGSSVPLAGLKELRVCAARKHDWADAICASAAYDAKKGSVTIKLPQ